MNHSFEFLMQCPCSDGSSNPLLLLALCGGALLMFNWIKALIKSKGVSFMNKAMKITIVVALVVIVGTVFALKQQNKSSTTQSLESANPEPTMENMPANLENPEPTEAAVKLPHLVDLGAGKCIPCKMMKPILDELKKDYKDQFKVTFIDVWENPDEAKKSGIKIIPTQVFYDASGKELFRHEGFYSKEDILGKWKELGINVEKGK
jgi:thioredoxin 1